jgi:hypothetical protein
MWALSGDPFDQDFARPFTPLYPASIGPDKLRTGTFRGMFARFKNYSEFRGNVQRLNAIRNLSRKAVRIAKEPGGSRDAPGEIIVSGRDKFPWFGRSRSGRARAGW